MSETERLQPIEWLDSGAVDRECPACGAPGEKAKLLKIHYGIQTPNAGVVEYSKCPACSSVFQLVPVPLSYEDEDFHGGESFDFYLEQGASIDGMLNNLYLVPPAGRRYLEVGTGFGFSLDFARTVFGYECLGLDPSPIARLGASLLDLDIRPGYFTSPDDVPGKFDLIGCSEVIEHIADPLPFVRALAGTLTPEGAVWFTTPDAGHIRRDTSMTRLCSLVQGWHPILYTRGSLEAMLRAAGFAHVQVWEVEASLCAVASLVPKSVNRQAQVDRGDYQAYLSEKWAKADRTSAVACGLGVRLFKELVNVGDHQKAGLVGETLEKELGERFGIDLDHPLDLPLGDTFNSFGKHLPYGIATYLFHKGVWAQNHTWDLKLAETCFSAAVRTGSALQGVLREIGFADQETYHLTVEAMKNALAILRYQRVDASLERVNLLRSVASPVLSDVAAVLEDVELQLRLQTLTHLVMSGRYDEFASLLGKWQIVSAEPAAPGSQIPLKIRADFMFASAMFTLNSIGDHEAAGDMFHQTFLQASSAPADESAGDLGQLAWTALFHEGLAHRLSGDLASAEGVAQMIHKGDAWPNLPPVDEALRRRIAELTF